MRGQAGLVAGPGSQCVVLRSGTGVIWAQLWSLHRTSGQRARGVPAVVNTAKICLLWCCWASGFNSGCVVYMYHA
jgi:hypothetical protein